VLTALGLKILAVLLEGAKRIVQLDAGEPIAGLLASSVEKVAIFFDRNFMLGNIE
jgi:hypothetical protein